jgi:hypothetical protein
MKLELEMGFLQNDQDDEDLDGIINEQDLCSHSKSNIKGKPNCKLPRVWCRTVQRSDQYLS